MLAVPLKRDDGTMVNYLTQEEMRAILKASDLQTWSGQRDQILLATLYNTVACVSEIIALRHIDLEGNSGPSVHHLHGKSRKE